MNIQEKSEVIENLWKKDIDILKGLSFNQKKNVERIYFYKNDKFVECSDDSAIFWNVTKPYIMHFAKNIDLDTKDFRAIGQGDTNVYQSWVLGMKFRKWANDKNLSIKIDDLTQKVSEFGSFVWKLVKTKGGYEIQECDLRNLKFNPKAKSIRDVDKVESHYLDYNAVIAKKEAWDNVDEVLKQYKVQLNVGEDVEFKEFTGYVEGVFTHGIYCGEGEKALTMYEEEIEPEDDMYYDFHLTGYDGRWQRIGAYETNYIPQERANTLVNENAAASAIASLLLLRTNDPNTQGNVLRGAISGQIITSNDLQQIGVDNRAAGQLLGELDRIEAQVRKNLLLPDVATGDTLNSVTTFRGQSMMNNAYKSAFKQMRNRLAEPLRDIIQEKVLPNEVRNWNKEEALKLVGDEADIELYDEAVKNLRKIALLEQRNAQGVAVSPEELLALDKDTEDQLPKVGRKIEHGKKFFDFKYGFIIDPVAESYDKTQQNEALVNAITMEMQNPAISESPRYKQLLENNGLKQAPLKPDVKQELTQNNQARPLTMPAQSLSGMVDTNL